MELELEIHGSLCSTSTFKINGIDADAREFGSQRDESPETAACGDMQFTPSAPDKEVCEKYGITEADFIEIADKLSEGLSFGCCSFCA